MNYKKVTSLFLFTTLSIGGVFAQSKEDLKSEIEQLKQQNQMLMKMMQNQQIPKTQLPKMQNTQKKTRKMTQKQQTQRKTAKTKKAKH